MAALIGTNETLILKYCFPLLSILHRHKHNAVKSRSVVQLIVAPSLTRSPRKVRIK